MIDKFRRLRHEIEFLFFAGIIILAWVYGRSVNLNTDVVFGPLIRQPIFFSGILYVFLYVVVTFFIFFSKDVFWLTGAVLFGPYLSTFFICIAEALNACVLFYLARRLGRAYVEKKLSEKYSRLDERLGGVNFFWLFIFRATPLIPYRFLDLAAGLTKLKFNRYFAAVILGSPVKMFWIQYILCGVGRNIVNNPAALAEYFLANKNLLLLSLIYILLVVMVIFKLNGMLKPVEPGINNAGKA